VNQRNLGGRVGHTGKGNETMTNSQSTVRPSQTFTPGGYRFLPAVFQFSGGVAAEPGHAIERVELRQSLVLADGLDVVHDHLVSIGRPLQALCSFELRSPGQFSDTAFDAFNRRYVETLDKWGLMDGDVNPVARTNVCPVDLAPPAPSIHAFAYTVPAPEAAKPHDFVTAGGAEAPEDGDGYHDKIISRGDTSIEGLRAKLEYVRDEQLVRLRSLGFTWADVNHVSAYSRHDVGPLLYAELLTQGVGVRGLTVHQASPPVADCDFEMDAHFVTSQVAK
jgi:hypothetical protein